MKELIPNDIPDPLGRTITATTFSGCKFESLLSHREISDWLFIQLIYTQKSKQQWKLLHMNQNL